MWYQKLSRALCSFSNFKNFAISSSILSDFERHKKTVYSCSFNRFLYIFLYFLEENFTSTLKKVICHRATSMMVSPNVLVLLSLRLNITADTAYYSRNHKHAYEKLDDKYPMILSSLIKISSPLQALQWWWYLDHDVKNHGVFIVYLCVGMFMISIIVSASCYICFPLKGEK